MKEQKKKISLDELKVQSFVTSLPEAVFNTIKGGESQGAEICECEGFNSGTDVPEHCPADSYEYTHCAKACGGTGDTPC